MWTEKSSPKGEGKNRYVQKIFNNKNLMAIYHGHFLFAKGINKYSQEICIYIKEVCDEEI